MITINNLTKWFSSMLLSIAPLFAYATIPAWEIIPSQSSLTFTATQNGAPVSGQFKNYTGEITFDQKDLKHSKVDIIVDIGSIAASYSDLTAALLTPDWFNAQVFPKAIFKSSDFKKTGEKTYQASGSLTIRDKTSPVRLIFTAIEPSQNMIHVEGSTTLKRSDFGVGQGEWASTKEIKDEVNVNFKLVAKQK